VTRVRRALVLSGLLLLVGAPVAIARQLWFKSPSGNITCVVSVRAAGPDFAQCELRSMRHRGGFSVRRRGDVTRYDVGYDDLRGQRFTLEYGSRIRSGPFVCVSRRTGMKCWSRVSGHGFKISRARRRVF
jgi:hypothetical protein